MSLDSDVFLNLDVLISQDHDQ